MTLTQYARQRTYAPEVFFRVDKDDCESGWGAGHGGHEVGEGVLHLEVVNPDVMVGGLARGEADPVNVPHLLAIWSRNILIVNHCPHEPYLHMKTCTHTALVYSHVSTTW